MSAPSVWSISVSDIEDTVIRAQERHSASRPGNRHRSQGPRIRLGRIGKAIHRADGKIIDNNDVVEGIVLLRKGADSESTLAAIHEKVEELNINSCRRE